MVAVAEKTKDISVKFYRSVLFNVIIDGLVSFLLPGLWYSLNYIGAAGLADPRQVNGANAVTFGIMIPGCTLAAVLANRTSLKWVLFAGAVLYTPYAAALYTLNRYNNIPFLYGGSVLCGLGASLFWCTESAIAIAYPLPHERGRMVSIWLGIRQFGMILGGAISLGYNIKGDSTGKISYSTYYAMIALMCLSGPAALLLSNPRKVRRSDGSHVKFAKNFNLKDEVIKIKNLATSRYLLALIPIFIFGQWGTVYQSNYLTTYFTVRTRALASLLAGIVSLISNLSVGWFLDQTRWNQRTRAAIVWVFLAITISGAWIWNAILQARFSEDVNNGKTIALDWEGSTGRFNSAFAVYGIMGCYNGGVNDITRTTGLIRSYQSIGSTFSYVVGAGLWPYFNQMILSLAFWFACLIPTCYAIYIVPKEEQVIDPVDELTSTDSDYEKGSPPETGNTTPIPTDGYNKETKL
ncbi:MFS general substrate transporter [Wallemia mellicola]|uniref:MFS general substrate transporter n=1 Tax=Wallemia mellicola TaxID=1708541 RepID=A0A4T0NRR8_9BASI|nr:MFS general substrate transporter [Wallemia mellicola]